MRLLAIGDVHGCLHQLDDLLAWVNPAADDLVITLGDYVDRGPDSRGVLDRLIGMKKEGRRLVCLHDRRRRDRALRRPRRLYWERPVDGSRW